MCRIDPLPGCWYWSLSYSNFALWHNAGTCCFMFLSHRATPGNPTKWSSPFFSPRTFHNYQKSQFSSKVVKISLWKHLKRTLNSNFFLFVCLFSWCWQIFFFLLLQPQSSPVLPHGKDFFIKTCLIIPLSSPALHQLTGLYASFKNKNVHTGAKAWCRA